MSRRVAPYSKNSVSSEQTFSCKVCKDAGESVSMFTSHNVKDANGRTSCPTLLSTCCRNCENFGHSAPYCKTVSFKVKKDAKSIRLNNKKVIPEANSNKSTTSNLFADLAETSDEETPQTPTKFKDAKEANLLWAPVKVAKKKPANWADWESDDEE